MATGQWRTNLIRKARTIQRSNLRMTDEDYHTMLADRYGKTSTKALNMGELQNLVDHLADLSGQPAPDGRKPVNVDAQARKIWVLWQELHKAGQVRDPSERGLNTFLKRRCRVKVDSYAWLSRAQATDVIEILKKWLERVQARTATQSKG